MQQSFAALSGKIGPLRELPDVSMKFLKKYSLVIVLVFGISMFLNPAINMMIMGSLTLCIGVSAALFIIRIQYTEFRVLERF